MKKMLLFIVCGIISGVTNGQPMENLSRMIEKKLSGLAIHQSKNHDHRFCATTLLFSGKKNFDKLTTNAQSILNKMSDRPVLANVEMAETDHFVLHYTTSGDDELYTLEDEDENDIPDYIDFMAELFEEIYTIYENMGYLMPPSDDQNSPKYDIYFALIDEGILGYVAGEDEIGDHPGSTDRTETSSMTSFMVMRSDGYEGYTGSDEEDLDLLKSTAAHEFFHSIQFGYVSTGNNWMYESTATWAEDIVFPGSLDHLWYMTDIFLYPDIPLNLSMDDEMEGDGFDGRWYGSWIFFRYLTEQSDVSYVKGMITRMSTGKTILASMAEESTFWNGQGKPIPPQLNGAINRFFTALYLLSNREQDAPYVFSRANDYADFMLDFSGNRSVKIEGDSNNRLMRMSADYKNVSIAGGDTLIYTQTSGASGNFILVLLQLDANGNFVHRVTSQTFSGGKVKLVADGSKTLDQAVAILIDTRLSESDLTSRQYSLSVSKGVSTSVESETPNSVYLAQNFPNPFNPSTMIAYQTISTGVVTITVYDVMGREVETLLNEVKPAGNYQVPFHATNLSSGIYYYTLKANDVTYTKKMSLIK